MSGRSFVAVDVGNSRIHFARFDSFDPQAAGPPESTFSCLTSAFDSVGLRGWIAEKELPWFAISVNRSGTAALKAWVDADSVVQQLRWLTHRELPIQTVLNAPDKIGADRLAAAVMANHLRSADRAAIVVDAGTAITIDAVSPRGQFLGGAILPGMRMAANALAGQTDLLPEIAIDPDETPAAIGIDTPSAMRSGLFWTAVGGVRETILRIQDQLGESANPHVYFAGGDVRRLAPRIQLNVEEVPEMVTRGIALAASQLL